MRADNLKNYLEHKETMTKAAKGVKLQKAIEAIDAAIKEEKDKVRIHSLSGLYLSECFRQEMFLYPTPILPLSAKPMHLKFGSQEF